ncbi:MAG TPA: RDD family protein [Acidimicrobiales bacterium]|nr:RDD family protein [Acidimicrobiales bacterium]
MGWARPAPTRRDAPLGRRAAARAIDVALVLLVAYVAGRFVPGERVVARLVLALAAMTAYEALFVIQLRATPGKLATALRVAELDRVRVDQGTAWIRGAVTSAGTAAVVLAVVPGGLAGTRGVLPAALRALLDSGAGLLLGGALLVVAAAYVMGIVTAPLHRGIADRVAGTVVVPFEAPELVTSQEVGAGTEARRPRPHTAWGPVARPDARRRARTARLDDAPLLVVGLVAVIVAWALDPTTLVTLLGLRVPVVAAALVVAWSALLVVDETWRIARDAGTAGHRREGLAVVDEATGEAPGRGRALARAVVLGVFWLFPPLLPVLLLWVELSPTGQGPHDLVAGTVVVEVPGRGPA